MRQGVLVKGKSFVVERSQEDEFGTRETLHVDAGTCEYVD